MSLFDVNDDEAVLNCCDVVVVGDVNELLIAGVQDVNVFDEVVAKLIPLDEVVLEEVGVNDVDRCLSIRCDETCWLHF